MNIYCSHIANLKIALKVGGVCLVRNVGFRQGHCMKEDQKGQSSLAPCEFVNQPGILSRTEPYIRQRGDDRE